MKRLLGGIAALCAMMLCAFVVQVKAADSGAPSNVNIVQIANDAIDLHWDAPETGTVSSYKIYTNWKEGSLDHEYTSVYASDISATATHYICDGITNGYYVWVAAVMSDGTERVSDAQKFQAEGTSKYISFGYGTLYVNDQLITARNSLNEKVVLIALGELVPSDKITVVSTLCEDGLSADIKVYSYNNRGSISQKVYFYESPVEMVYNEGLDAYEISTAEQLSVFANIVNGKATKGTDYTLSYEGATSSTAILVDDINIGARTISICNAADVELNLNGYQITGSGEYVFNLYKSDVTVLGGAIYSNNGKGIFKIDGGNVSLQNQELGYADDLVSSSGTAPIWIGTGDVTMNGVKMNVTSQYCVYADEDQNATIRVSDSRMVNNCRSNSAVLYLKGYGSLTLSDNVMKCSSGPVVYSIKPIQIQSGYYFGCYTKTWSSSYSMGIHAMGGFSMSGGFVYGAGVGVLACADVNITGGSITARGSCGPSSYYGTNYCVALLIKHPLCRGACSYTVELSGGHFLADCADATYNYAVASWNGGNFNSGYGESGHALDSFLADGCSLDGTVNEDGNVVTSAEASVGKQRVTVKHFVMQNDKTYAETPTATTVLMTNGTATYYEEDLARTNYDSSRARSLFGMDVVVRDLQTYYGLDYVTVNGEDFVSGTIPADAVICVYYQWEKYALVLFDTGLDGKSTTLVNIIGVWAGDMPDFPSNSEMRAAGYGAEGYKSTWSFDDSMFCGTWRNQAAYCTWEESPYTITYVLNGGRNSSSNPSTFTSKTETFTFAAATKTGYQFGGWFTDASCTTPITGVTKGTSDDLTVYAKWIANEYHIAFNGNGATAGSTATMDCSYATSYALNANGFTKTGYIFKNWNTKADGSGTAYANKASVSKLTSTNGKTVTLYAQWTAIAYSIQFDGNGATSGSMTMLASRKYGTTYTLTANGFKKTGYTFKCWNTRADGKGTAYADKASVMNLSATNNSTVTLYAQWTANTYTIKFNGNGATSGTMSSLTSRKYGTAYTLTANAYKKTGYYLASWNTKADGSGTAYKDKASVKNLTATNGGTVTLYAQWKLVTYTIAFDGNGATSGKMSALTSRKYGTSYTLTANAFKRTGYDFTGWNTAANGSGKAYANKASVKNLTSSNGKTVTLYAQWKAHTYTIKFDGNGATSGKMSSLTSRKYGSSYTLTANAFKKTNYAFVGWNTKKDGSGKSYTDKASIKNLTSTNGGTVTLYAQWKLITYTIKFDGNGATSGKMSSLTSRKYGTSYTLTANAFKRTGYVFKGWNTKKDGSGKTYANKATVKNLTSTPGKTVTLYAIWAKK